MLLSKSQLHPIHIGRADQSSYLIIFFDAKYQRYADDDTHNLNNEVHSYQYCRRVIERDCDDSAAPIWSMLLKSKGPYVSD
mgnify:CR=1 FL=1